eukprot:5303318-Prymnesium_polylepis.1
MFRGRGRASRGRPGGVARCPGGGPGRPPPGGLVADLQVDGAHAVEEAALNADDGGHALGAREAEGGDLTEKGNR